VFPPPAVATPDFLFIHSMAYHVIDADPPVATQSFNIDGGTVLYFRIASITTHPLQLRDPLGTSLRTDTGRTVAPYDESGTYPGVVTGYIIYTVPSYEDQLANFGVGGTFL
jgi:hypothetical protein